VVALLHPSEEGSTNLTCVQACPANAARRFRLGCPRPDSDLAAVPVERSELRSRALLGRRLDNRITLWMGPGRRTEVKYPPPAIPERHEVIEAVGAAAIDIPDSPIRANRIVATQPMRDKNPMLGCSARQAGSGAAFSIRHLSQASPDPEEVKIIDPDIDHRGIAA